MFNKLIEEAIAGYDKIIGLDLSEVAVDGSLHKAPGGGEENGPNPTDRAKIGWKWSIATDLFGIPIGWVIDGANRNDSSLTTKRSQGLGLTDVVCAKKRHKGDTKIKKPLTLGMR